VQVKLMHIGYNLNLANFTMVSKLYGYKNRSWEC